MQLLTSPIPPALPQGAAVRFVAIIRARSGTPAFRYALPFLALGLALALQTAISRVVTKQSDFPYVFLYLIAIFVTAWVGGYVPGVTTCLLTMVGLPAFADRAFHGEPRSATAGSFERRLASD